MEPDQHEVLPIPEMPGELGGGVSIKIHTKHGWRLIYSKKSDGTSSPITGLFKFASRMNVLWVASTNNDPFADMYMDEVRHHIDNALYEFDERQKMLDLIFKREHQKGLAFDLASSNEPIIIPLNFSNPYGYLGSRLVSKCDEFIRTTFTCRHVGIISYEKHEKNIRWAMKTVLSTFDRQRDYKLTGVTRDDFVLQNDKWLSASKSMKMPTADMIQGQQAKISPMRITTEKKVQSEQK
ncbi:MAG: TIGR03761 family integrating conjugative element protein [Mariprofundaceae bacterium]|nr:TIGR03761 family integrating conjugative element protein [Mariprofundaceae bacterium]